MLHVLGDLVQSAGVALAGALIWYNEVRMYVVVWGWPGYLPVHVG